MVRHHRSRAQATERLPDDVALVRRGANGQLDELERLLAAVQAAELVPHAVALALDPFRAADLRLAPDIGHAYGAIELGPHLPPLAGRNGALAVHAEVGSPRRVSALVGVQGQFHEGLDRGIIPQVVCGEVFPRGRVENPARLVGQMEGQPAAPPFVPEPFLHGQRFAARLEPRRFDVVDAHLGNDGELAEGLGVGVARHMPHPLVPNVAAAVLPPVRDQNRMDGRPPHLSVPEPQRRLRRGAFAPSADVRLVPFGQRLGLVVVPGESADAVRPVGDDADRAGPIGVQGFGAVEMDGAFAADEDVAGKGGWRHLFRPKEQPQLQMVRCRAHVSGLMCSLNLVKPFPQRDVPSMTPAKQPIRCCCVAMATAGTPVLRHLFAIGSKK